MRIALAACLTASVLSLPAFSEEAPSWTGIVLEELDLAYNAVLEKNGGEPREASLARMTCDPQAEGGAASCRYRTVDVELVAAGPVLGEPLRDVILMVPTDGVTQRAAAAIVILMRVFDPDGAQDGELLDTIARGMKRADGAEVVTAVARWKSKRVAAAGLSIVMVEGRP